jgi:hypothetical protein
MESGDAAWHHDRSIQDAALLRGVFAIRAFKAAIHGQMGMLFRRIRFVYYQSLTEIS